MPTPTRESFYNATLKTQHRLATNDLRLAMSVYEGVSEHNTHRDREMYVQFRVFHAALMGVVLRTDNPPEAHLSFSEKYWLT